MPTVTPYNPDGTRQISGPGSRQPYTRENETRAIASALKAWWTRKGIPVLPPEGAELEVDGVRALRYERVPVIEDGEVVATRLEWVDLRERRRQEEEARHLAAAKAAYAAKVSA